MSNNRTLIYKVSKEEKIKYLDSEYVQMFSEGTDVYNRRLFNQFYPVYYCINVGTLVLTDGIQRFRAEHKQAHSLIIFGNHKTLQAVSL
uniref:Uncharacterized protein n=1 Tax=Oryza brachyantha TaxID=4533 RepID=J3LL68_ORYBR